jgi:hypothetical protein
MTKRLDQLTLLLLVVTGSSLIVGESMAKPSGRQSSQPLTSPRPAGISASPADAIRSGLVYWDYRVGIRFAPGSQVKVSQSAVGGTLLENVTFGMTVSGYEYVP